jgi:hypothetical protein
LGTSFEPPDGPIVSAHSETPVALVAEQPLLDGQFADRQLKDLEFAGIPGCFDGGK